MLCIWYVLQRNVAGIEVSSMMVRPKGGNKLLYSSPYPSCGRGFSNLLLVSAGDLKQK